jgi:hypothetical protein
VSRLSERVPNNGSKRGRSSALDKNEGFSRPTGTQEFNPASLFQAIVMVWPTKNRLRLDAIAGEVVSVWTGRNFSLKIDPHTLRCIPELMLHKSKGNPALQIKSSVPAGGDAIAKLAYDLWLSRGCPDGAPKENPDGSPGEDWYEAERTFKAKRDSTGTSAPN